MFTSTAGLLGAPELPASKRWEEIQSSTFQQGYRLAGELFL